MTSHLAVLLVDVMLKVGKLPKNICYDTTVVFFLSHVRQWGHLAVFSVFFLSFVTVLEPSSSSSVESSSTFQQYEYYIAQWLPTYLMPLPHVFWQLFAFDATYWAIGFRLRILCLGSVFAKSYVKALPRYVWWKYVSPDQTSSCS